MARPLTCLHSRPVTNLLSWRRATRRRVIYPLNVSTWRSTYRCFWPLLVANEFILYSGCAALSLGVRLLVGCLKSNSQVKLARPPQSFSGGRMQRHWLTLVNPSITEGELELGNLDVSGKRSLQRCCNNTVVACESTANFTGLTVQLIQ